MAVCAAATSESALSRVLLVPLRLQPGFQNRTTLHKAAVRRRCAILGAVRTSNAIFFCDKAY